MSRLRVDVVAVEARGDAGAIRTLAARFAVAVRAAGFECDMHENRVPSQRLVLLVGRGAQLDAVLEQVDCRWAVAVAADRDTDIADIDPLVAAVGTAEFEPLLRLRLAAQMRGATQLPPEAHLPPAPVQLAQRAPEHSRLGKLVLLAVTLLALFGLWDSIKPLFR